MAAWTDRGVEAAYLLLTRGEAGMDASPPELTADLQKRFGGLVFDAHLDLLHDLFADLDSRTGPTNGATTCAAALAGSQGAARVRQAASMRRERVGPGEVTVGP